jgi:hypothetical protein
LVIVRVTSETESPSFRWMASYRWDRMQLSGAATIGFDIGCG